MNRTMTATAVTLLSTSALLSTDAYAAPEAPGAPDPLEAVFSGGHDPEGDGSQMWLAEVNGDIPDTPNPLDGLSVFQVWADDDYLISRNVEDEKPELLGALDYQGTAWSDHECALTDQAAGPYQLTSEDGPGQTLVDDRLVPVEFKQLPDDARLVTVTTMNCQLETAPRENGDYLISDAYFVRTEAGGQFEHVASFAMEVSGREGGGYGWTTEPGWEWLPAYVEQGDTSRVPADKQWFVDNEWPQADAPTDDQPEPTPQPEEPGDEPKPEQPGPIVDTGVTTNPTGPAVGAGIAGLALLGAGATTVAVGRRR